MLKLRKLRLFQGKTRGYATNNANFFLAGLCCSGCGMCKAFVEECLIAFDWQPNNTTGFLYKIWPGLAI